VAASLDLKKQSLNFTKLYEIYYNSDRLFKSFIKNNNVINIKGAAA
jgi:hypothetical protein